MHVNQSKLLAGFIGLAVGLIVGFVVVLTTALPVFSVLVIAVLSSTLAVKLANPPHIEKRSLIAAALGLAMGSFAMLFRKFTTDADWQGSLVVGLFFGIFTALLVHAVIRKHERRQPDEFRARIPVLHDYAGKGKIDRCRHLLLIDHDNPENSEKVIRHFEGWHWKLLVNRTAFPLALTVLLLWGAADFPRYREILDALIGTLRPESLDWYELAKPVGLLIIIFGGFWRWKRSKNWRQLIRSTTAPSLVIAAGVWLYAGLPGATSIRESIASGSAAPWLTGALVAWLWAAYRSTDYFYGFVMLTDKRLIIGKINPLLLPSRVDPLFVNKNTGGAYRESIMGNALGYGLAIAEGIGLEDAQFRNLAPLAHYRELAAEINLVTARGVLS